MRYWPYDRSIALLRSILIVINRKENYHMRLFFWDFDDVNDIQREWSMFIVNALAVIFTTYCLIRTAKFHGKVLFELLPLAINTAATIILLFIKLFEKGYEYDLVGYVIELFTYFLFCYTFSLLHARIIQKQNLPVQKVCNALLLALASGVVIVIILVLTSTIDRNCDNNLIEGSYLCLATELLSYLPTLYFGIDILRTMSKKHRQQQQDESSSPLPRVFQTISDQYIKERKNQIKLVLAAYTLSLVLRAAVLGFNIDFDSYFICTECDGIYIQTSDQVIGQLILYLIEFNQLIPHLVIPIAFFIIPVGKHRKNHKIDLKETLLDQDEDESSDNGDYLQRRISRCIVKNNQESLLSQVETEQCRLGGEGGQNRPNISQGHNRSTYDN